MSVLAKSILSALGLGQTVHGFNHAGKTFTANSYGNAGRYKFLFHVYFDINSTVTSVDPRNLSYMVKNIDLPKFTIATKEMNQYNRKRYIQTEIKYNPVSIVFHDDNDAQIRDLWRAYYNYYFMDGRYNQNIYSYNDIYGARLKNNWGNNSGSYDPFFRSIQIYSLHASYAEKITLFNPLINSFSHDKHDYADGTGLLENTMQINYEGVKYETGTYQGIPGFGDIAFYDTNPSDLGGINIGRIINSIGNLVDATSDFLDKNKLGVDQQVVAEQLNAIDRNDINSNRSVLIPEQVITATTTPVDFAQPYEFPVLPTEAVSIGEITIDQSIRPPVTSEDEILLDPRQSLGVFGSQTWERSLEEKGYSIENINAAQNYINQLLSAGQLSFANKGEVLAASERFLTNPSNTTNFEILPFSLPPINFSTSIAGTSVVEASLNSNTWQSQLKDRGYNDFQIQYASDKLSDISLSEGIDVAAAAENLISTMK